MVVFNQSIGPLSLEGGARVARVLNKNGVNVIVRDRASLETLQHLGVQARLGGDPALLLSPGATVQRDRTTVLLAPRGDVLDANAGLKELTRSLQQKGRRVVALQADGSAMYTVQGLWTQARERLDVTTIILSNRKYAILLGEYQGVGATPGRTALDMMDLLEPVVENPRARMVSLMDHSPGIGQYANMDRYRRMRVREGHKADWIEGRIVELQDQRARMRGPNRRRLLDRVIPLGIVIASHDDNTAEEVAENAADGIRISEFPVSHEAASAARQRGMQVIAGAPNIVRGGSHSGNVAAADLVRAGVVDAYASDYVPSSMLEAAFGSVAAAGTTLPQGVAMVTDGPARMCGLHDRGRIEAGLRADLVRVREWDGLAVVRQVWRAGERVV